jgi:capsular exopolysaccharide synthesis family protein
VLVGPPIADAQPLVELDPATEREIATSRAVATMAIARLVDADRVGVEQLREGLTVEVVGDGRVLDFAYQHTDPGVAQRRAQAFAEAYLSFRRRGLQEDMVAHTVGLGSRIEVLERLFERLSTRIAATSDPVTLGFAEARITAVLREWLQAEIDLAALGRLPDVARITEAASPGAPSGPDHFVAGGAGLLMGLVLGLCYAGVRVRRDDRIASAADLEATADAPVIGRIPRSRMISRRQPRIDAPRASPKTAEAYRIMRTNLVAAAGAGRARSVAVTSVSSGQSSAIISMNVAVALAQAGKRIALVAADARRPQLGSMLGLPSSPGLTDVLAGKQEFEQVLLPLSIQGRRTDSWFLPPGSPVDDPAGLLDSGLMVDVLDGLLRNGMEFVLIDAPAILGTADAAAIARLTDAVLLVVDARHVTHASLASALRRLERVDSDVLGIAVTEGRQR